MPMPVKYRPEGQITRGKTARNRLRRSDIFLMLTEEPLIRLRDPRAFYVDLGYGFEPFTTLETASRLRQMNPDLPVLGVEIEPERVKAGEPFADEKTFFRLGGFNLPLLENEKVRIIRAFNVLRQYDEREVAPAWELMGSQLMPGGMIIEGTSNPYGMVWTANLLHRSAVPPYEVRNDAFVFSTNFHMGFEPDLFQPILTKNYIHRMVPDEKIFEFMEKWKEACRKNAFMRSYGLRQLFIASAYELANAPYHIDLRKKLLNKGFLVWRY